VYIHNMKSMHIYEKTVDILLPYRLERRVAMSRISDMELRREVHSAIKDGCLLYFKGKMDATNADHVLGQIKQLINNGDIHVVADFTDVHSINSSGLGALLQAINHAKEKGGTFVICNANERVLQLVDLNGARMLLDLCDSIDEAVSARA